MTEAPYSPACTGFMLGRRNAAKIPRSVHTNTMSRIRIQAPDVR